MSIEPISADLVKVALDRVGGTAFERFSQEFLSSLLGPDFVPVGGVKDGGADGLFEDDTASGFMQASVEVDVERKIIQTVERLREFERQPKDLLYASSQTVKHVDKIERDLTNKLDVRVRIFEASYWTTHVNDTPQTQAAFRTHLEPVTAYLRAVGASRVLTPSAHVTSPAVFVFLRQELERRSGDTNLLDAVTDALILWALDETSPDPHDDPTLMSAGDILHLITTTVPFAKAFIKDRLEERLLALSAKEQETSRIRWYQKRGGFCLPFETRKQIEDENIEDESLRVGILASLADRAETIAGDSMKPELIASVPEIALHALQLLFEQEGLELAAYIEGNDAPAKLDTVQDAVREALKVAEVRPKLTFVIGDAVLGVLKGVFYSSREEERLYLGKLSRTYSLLFTLNTEPRLVAYFQEMAADFNLYVGSDILVRAVSERYLDEKDQMTRNALRLAAEAGARLILAQPVLEEVLGNLRASNTEYEVNFGRLGGMRLREAELQSPRILVRAFFHARDNELLGKQRPQNWPAYVNQFVTHSRLGQPEAPAELRGYLVNEFNLTYQAREELESLVDMDELHELTEALSGLKKDQQLARNDALMTLAVYGRRGTDGEYNTVSEFGYKTWWLTHESKILAQTREVVAKHEGARYMMRPEFLLNFLALAPSAAEVRKTYKNIFPTVLGVRLSKRMAPDVFHTLMKKVRESDEVEPARRQAQIAQMADELKGDFAKAYTTGFGGEPRTPDAETL